MPERVTGSGAAGPEQAVLGDGGQGERLVADLVEQDDEAVVLDAHDHAGAPLGVLHRRLYLERAVDVLGRRRLLGAGVGAGVVVAVAAGLVELLAEVAEQELAAALGGV